MNANRRGFFGAIASLAAGGLLHPSSPQKESDSARELRELGESFERLRAQMEKPINVQIQIDGREVARHAVELMPKMIVQRGLL